MTDSSYQGKRVLTLITVPATVEGTVVAETENGLVIDIDMDTAVLVDRHEDRDRDREIVERYLRRSAPEAQHPVWVGRAHLDKVEPLTEKPPR